jgi:protein-S-isoprenylcysteine O-methyltransferase Ste14
MKYLICLSLAYGFSELSLMFIRRSYREEVKTRNDRGSLLLMWITITIGFAGAFIFSGRMSQLWTGIGLIIIIAGLIIRWISILQLGNSFTVDVAIAKSAILKTNGIYKKIRHPSYLGILLVVAGFSATLCSLGSLLVLVLPVFIAVIYRITVEEKVLIDEFGSKYLEYMNKTKKLIPGVY